MTEAKPELVECRACGHQISVKAKSCPNCGDRYSLKEKFDIWNKKRKQIYEKLEEERIRKHRQGGHKNGSDDKTPVWVLLLYWTLVIVFIIFPLIHFISK